MVLSFAVCRGSFLPIHPLLLSSQDDDLVNIENLTNAVAVVRHDHQGNPLPMVHSMLVCELWKLISIANSSFCIGLFHIAMFQNLRVPLKKPDSERVKWTLVVQAAPWGFEQTENPGWQTPRNIKLKGLSENNQAYLLLHENDCRTRHIYQSSCLISTSNPQLSRPSTKKDLQWPGRSP